MNVNLYYKSYPVKMTLGAMKQFNTETGLDLWHTLLRFRECFFLSIEDPTISRLVKLNGLVDFYVGAKALHALIKAENKSIPLEEVEDAMFRAGWVESDDMQAQPWTLVLVKLANEIDEEFSQSTAKKKADIKAQATKV